MTRQTRGELRAEILRQVYELVQCIEVDWNEHNQATWTAERLSMAVRTYFDRERWQPTPVYDGIVSVLPLEVPVTIRLQHHEEAWGLHWIRGRITATHPVYRPHDGACLEVVPQRCRNTRRHRYHARTRASLTVWRGHLDEAQAAKTAPIYQHTQAPRIDIDATQPGAT